MYKNKINKNEDRAEKFAWSFNIVKLYLLLVDLTAAFSEFAR